MTERAHQEALRRKQVYREFYRVKSEIDERGFVVPKNEKYEVKRTPRSLYVHLREADIAVLESLPQEILNWVQRRT